MDAELAAELAAMVAEDQRVRARPGQPPAGGYRLTTAQAMEHSRVDVGNTDRLRDIVARRGWPGFALVGEQGEKDAWLAAQHADRQLGFSVRRWRFLSEPLPMVTRVLVISPTSPTGSG